MGRVLRPITRPFFWLASFLFHVLASFVGSLLSSLLLIALAVWGVGQVVIQVGGAP